MKRLSVTWNSLGRRSGLVLIAAGALLITEAILSHIFRDGWSGDYGLQRILAIVLGAGAIVAGGLRVWRTWTGWPSEGEVSQIRRRCTPFLVAACVYFVAFLIMAPIPQGDQPHYELESVGLAIDQTRDMSLDYADPSRFGLMFPLGVPDVHAFRYKRHGELVGVQNVGLPLLLAPAVPLVQEAGVLSWSKHLWPWNIEMILFAALAAQLLYGILSRLRPRHPYLVAGVWASVVFSPPMVVYASQIYPEIPAVLLALIAVEAMLRPPTRRTIMVGAGAAVLMPWLHVRFLPIAVVLVVALAIRAVDALPPQQRRTREVARRGAWAVVPLVVSQLVMAVAFQHWYGSFLPNAQYRLPQTRQPQTLSASWTALARVFWSSTDGWLPFAPVGILALASIGYAIRRHPRWAICALAGAGLYLLDLTVEGSRQGFSFPGRYALILIPFSAIPLLIAAADVPRVRWVFWPLTVLTIYLAVAVVFEPPPTVSGVPGFTGPAYPQLLWPWFANLWPQVVPSAAHFYPDAGAVLALSLSLLAISVGGYFIAPRTAPGAASA